MKSWISLILAVIFLSSILIFNIRQPKSPLKLPLITPPLSPTATPLPTLDPTDCKADDLVATISFQGAAGTMYGTAKLTNNTSSPCYVQLGNKLDLNYLPTIKNIQVTYTGTASAGTYKLLTKESLYAILRLPNGPQCQSGVHQVQASLTYQINSLQTMTFINQNKSDFMINACVNQSEVTQVQIAPLSPQPGP